MVMTYNSTNNNIRTLSLPVDRSFPFYFIAIFFNSQ